MICVFCDQVFSAVCDADRTFYDYDDPGSDFL